jgi:hypothetical protein
VEKVGSSVFKKEEQAAIHSRLAVTPKKIEKEQPKPQIAASHSSFDIHRCMSRHIRTTSESSATSPIIADLNCRIAKNVDSTKANYELQRKFSDHLLKRLPKV